MKDVLDNFLSSLAIHALKIDIIVYWCIKNKHMAYNVGNTYVDGGKSKNAQTFKDPNTDFIVFL